jgi:hypothetical protein
MLSGGRVIALMLAGTVLLLAGLATVISLQTVQVAG